LTGSSVSDTGMMNTGISESPDTLAILEEAHSVIEGQTKAVIPEVPDNLKHEIIQKRHSDVLI